jgi:hypothetical protein
LGSWLLILMGRVTLPLGCRQTGGRGRSTIGRQSWKVLCFIHPNFVAQVVIQVPSAESLLDFVRIQRKHTLASFIVSLSAASTMLFTKVIPGVISIAGLVIPGMSKPFSLRLVRERALAAPFPHDNPAGLAESYVRETGGLVIPVEQDEWQMLLHHDGVTMPPQVGLTPREGGTIPNITDPNDPVGFRSPCSSCP